MIQPLASADESPSMTNLSRSFSLTIFDENGKEIVIQTNGIEFFIPRDPNWIIPAMFLQRNSSDLLIQYHQYSLSTIDRQLTFSIHLEMHPIDKNLSYFFMYQFDIQPRFQSIDQWMFFCPKDLNLDGNYVHFLNNEQTKDHQMIFYGIRQMNQMEMKTFCTNESVISRPIFTKSFQFTSDYLLRAYRSGCFYLDENHQWQSDGLTVCYSHLFILLL